MAEQFVAKAEIDLRAATILAAESGLANVVCFHCQQAVEKMLKAALLASGSEPPYGVAPRYPGWEGESGAGRRRV